MSAINISVFGDTIYVANGVYKERIDMVDGLTFIGAGMDSCVIDTRNFPLTSPFYSIETGDSCYLSGIKVLTYDLNNGTGIRLKNSNIMYCTIKYAATGITINTGYQEKPMAYKNIILDVADGITTVFAQSIIKENIIYPKEDGLVSQLNSAPTYINNTIVINNGANLTFGYLDWGLISKLKNNFFYSLDNSGTNGIYSFNDTIINNLVFGEWASGINSSGSIIINNHIEKTLTGLRYAGSTLPIVQYNNLWNNQTNFQSFSPDSTNIFVDPMFVNEDSMDFHLQKYSPLIDAGDPNILDVDGSRSDIGLYGGPFGESYTYLDLAPRPPKNLTAEVDSNIITLRWDKNTEADFNHYNLYRDTTANFAIDTTKLVASLQDTFYLHLIPAGIESLYFKLTGVDNQGNESNQSEELVIIITSVNENPQIASNYQLYQNFPSPFNPSTKIKYKLKEKGYVKLYVYDIKGELISVLVNLFQDAGYYEVGFSGRDLNNQIRIDELASGIYIYQLHIINENNIPVFTDIGKMILLK